MKDDRNEFRRLCSLLPLNIWENARFTQLIFNSELDKHFEVA